MAPTGRDRSCDPAAQEIVLSDPNRGAERNTMHAGDQIEHVAPFEALEVTPNAPLGALQAEGKRTLASPSVFRSRPGGRLAQQRDSRVPGESTPRLFLQPNNLTSYCWIELMQVVAAEATIQRCLNCARFFPRGIERGTRSTRQYCSDRCRVTMHRKSKRRTPS